ncbi:MAG: YaiI/YqxD family protein [Alphaproteobacteria bacterium]
MKIWVDGDACPKGIKEILYRVATRTKIAIIFVANQYLNLPQSEYIEMVQVGEGADVADDKIVELCGAEDIVITADIPLAARVVGKGALALDPRGTLYDRNNIGQILSMRDFMDELRGSGVETGGPSSFGAKERQNFANQLDRLLAQRS